MYDVTKFHTKITSCQVLILPQNSIVCVRRRGSVRQLGEQLRALSRPSNWIKGKRQVGEERGGEKKEKEGRWGRGEKGYSFSCG